MVEELEKNDDQIHCLDKNEPHFYIKKEDHDQFFAETSNNCKSDHDDYKKGYQNVILEFQKQYDLRNRTVVVSKDKNKTYDNQLLLFTLIMYFISYIFDMLNVFYCSIIDTFYFLNL